MWAVAVAAAAARHAHAYKFSEVGLAHVDVLRRTREAADAYPAAGYDAETQRTRAAAETKQTRAATRECLDRENCSMRDDGLRAARATDAYLALMRSEHGARCRKHRGAPWLERPPQTTAETFLRDLNASSEAARSLLPAAYAEAARQNHSLSLPHGRRSGFLVPSRGRRPAKIIETPSSSLRAQSGAGTGRSAGPRLCPYCRGVGICRGDASRRRRGCDVEVSWIYVAATPRLRVWIVRGGRKGGSVTVWARLSTPPRPRRG